MWMKCWVNLTLGHLYWNTVWYPPPRKPLKPAADALDEGSAYVEDPESECYGRPHRLFIYLSPYCLSVWNNATITLAYLCCCLLLLHISFEGKTWHSSIQCIVERTINSLRSAIIKFPLIVWVTECVLTKCINSVCVWAAVWVCVCVCVCSKVP